MVIRPLFSSDRTLLTRSVVMIIISIVMAVFVAHSRAFLAWVSSKKFMVLSPIYHVVDYPQKLVRRIYSRWMIWEDLEAENIRLLHDNILLRAKINQLAISEKENKQLRKLLSSSFYSDGHYMLTEILRVNVAGSDQMVIINKGESAGVYIGQPVFDGYGVFGQVVAVGNKISQVMLISDKNSAVPVVLQYNRSRYIAQGMGDKTMIMLHVLDSDAEHFRKHQLLVTSGLDTVYPYGYPVAEIESVRHLSGEHFAQVRLKPIAHLYQSHELLLVWVDKHMANEKLTPLQYKTIHK